MNLFDLLGEISTPGSYKLSMRSFINCANDSCENAGDSIKVIGVETVEKELYRIDYSKGRFRDQEWVLDEFYFQFTSILFHVKTFEHITTKICNHYINL